MKINLLFYKSRKYKIWLKSNKTNIIKFYKTFNNNNYKYIIKI